MRSCVTYIAAVFKSVTDVATSSEDVNMLFSVSAIALRMACNSKLDDKARTSERRAFEASGVTPESGGEPFPEGEVRCVGEESTVVHVSPQAREGEG